ncbi:DUF1330 domain-containing protein [Comamonadaceae bacterium PP-2]
MNNLIAPTVVAVANLFATATGHAQALTSPSSAAAGIATTLPGYLVSNFTIRDEAMFQKYLEAVRPITIKYKGNAEVFNLNVRKVEGNPHSVMAVIKFPSYADVESFYFSPEYTEVKKLRIASTEGTVVLTEGFVRPQQ